MILHKTYRSALVTIPPDHIWAPIQTIRQQHDSKIRRWMPHITLIYPFCPESEFHGVAGELTTACRRLRPFEVTLREFQTFSHRKGSYTFWLKPEPTEPLVELHRALTAAISPQPGIAHTERRFVPHLSVGQVRGRRQRDDLLKELQTAWQPLSFTLSAIQFIKRGDPPDDVFGVVETIQLGSCIGN